MNKHFDQMYIDAALSANILPQACCPRTYFVPNDNEMDEEFEEDCPACKEAGYLTKEHIAKLDKQIELSLISKKLENVALSDKSSESDSDIELSKDLEKTSFIGEMITDVFSNFISSIFGSTIDKEETAIKLDKSKKIEKEKYLKKKNRKLTYPVRVKKYAIKKHRSNKKKNRTTNFSKE